MKNLKFIWVVVIAAATMSSCTTYKNSSRLTDVHNKRIQSQNLMVDVETDFNTKVKGNSKTFRGLNAVNAARDNAYYDAIVNNKIDVLVDPIYEVKTLSTIFGNFTTAEVTGYAGKYKNIRTVPEEQLAQYELKLDALKKLTEIDAIVKEDRKTVIVTGGLNGAAATEINTAPALVQQFNALYHNTNISQSQNYNVEEPLPEQDNRPQFLQGGNNKVLKFVGIAGAAFILLTLLM